MKVLSYPLYALCVDGGGVTGLALLLYTKDSVEIVDRQHYGDQDTVWRVIKETLDDYRRQGHNIVLVVEQFDQRPGMVNPDFSTKFINRDIDINIAGEYDVYWQIPAAAFNLVRKPGAKNKGADHLKRFGPDWYLKGRDNNHINDAVRHGIVFAVETLKHMPTILLGWPKPKDDN